MSGSLTNCCSLPVGLCVAGRASLMRRRLPNVGGRFGPPWPEGFTLDPATVGQGSLQHHITAFCFGVVRIDWLKSVLPFSAHALVAFRLWEQEDIRTLPAANGDEIHASFIRYELAAVSHGKEELTASRRRKDRSAGLLLRVVGC